MEYYSAIKRNWVICRDVDGPRECHEVSQKEKNKYCILTHICGISKNGIDDLIRKAEVETDVENKCMDTKGEGGVGGIGRLGLTHTYY